LIFRQQQALGQVRFHRERTECKGQHIPNI
jgi:hypothetical protein